MWMPLFTYPNELTYIIQTSVSSNVTRSSLSLALLGVENSKSSLRCPLSYPGFEKTSEDNCTAEHANDNALKTVPALKNGNNLDIGWFRSREAGMQGKFLPFVLFYLTKQISHRDIAVGRNNVDPMFRNCEGIR